MREVRRCLSQKIYVYICIQMYMSVLSYMYARAHAWKPPGREFRTQPVCATSQRSAMYRTLWSME